MILKDLLDKIINDKYTMNINIKIFTILKEVLWQEDQKDFPKLKERN